MLFLLTILIVLSAVVLLTVFVKRRTNSPLLEENSSVNFISESYRPLFRPDDEEIRAFEKVEKAKIEQREKAKEIEENRRLSAQKAEKVREFREFWQMSLNRRNTIQLLLLAAQSESGKIYSETAESVLTHWRAGEIEDLTAEHLAHVLESHFRLLPNEERTPGGAFWLEQEIAGLRRNSAGKN